MLGDKTAQGCLPEAIGPALNPYPKIAQVEEALQARLVGRFSTLALRVRAHCLSPVKDSREACQEVNCAEWVRGQMMV
jgi:hypothetical protein